MAWPNTVVLDGKTYAVAAGTKVERRTVQTFGQVRRVGKVGVQDFGRYQSLTLSGPLSVGQRTGNDPRRCYDQYGILAMWPGQITRGPQAQTPTQTAFPTTYKMLSGQGFIDAIGKFFVFGDASAVVNGEPMFYFVGGTTTWTSAAFNSSISGDASLVVGMIQRNNTLYAITDKAYADGTGNNRITWQSTDGITWSRLNTNAADELMPATPANATLKFLRAIQGIRGQSTLNEFYAIGYNATTFQAGITFRTFDTSSNWIGNAPMGSNAVPRGLEVNSSRDGTPDLFGSTNVGLYLYDRSNALTSLIYAYGATGGTYTGITIAGQDSRIYFADGPQVKSFRYTDRNGSVSIETISPPSVPTEALGDITAFGRSQDRPWIYVAKGGLAAGRNARVYVYDVSIGDKDPEHAWFCIYRHATAQRAITALGESRQDDGTVRLHMMIESAAGGTQAASYLANITINPLDVTSFAYAATGQILDSERDMQFGGLRQKGFLTVQLDADNLTANEYVDVLNGQNGATPTNSQRIQGTTSPAQVWMDKTDGTAGIGVSAKRQQIQLNLTGTAGATPGPTIKSVDITYLVANQKANGTLPEEIQFTVDLEETARLDSNFGSAEAVKAALRTTAANGALANLTLDAGNSLTVATELVSTLQLPQTQAAIQQPPSGGTVVVLCREVI